MSLSLYDTMARQKRRFVPQNPERVTMYVCGPTVYNFAHIGNFRPVVVFDVLFRLLRHIYGEAQVTYAANVTDVDDKINTKAAAEGVPIATITQRYLAAYNADAAALGSLKPTVQPLVTDTIEAIVAMIGRLVDNGSAYAAEGHVLFSTSSFPDYGKLSGRSLDDMIAGARVDVAPYKKNPADFVLWKPSKENEPEWESPWGPGRPGWHIECSAMIEETLGLPIDIHGGGNDLIFPHHENEMAQGLCAAHEHGGNDPTAYAKYWLHNGFLNFGDEKMSKSLGNVVLAHDLLAEVPGEVVRWALLAGHYRQPLEWTESLMEQSRSALNRLYGVLLDAGAALGDDGLVPGVLDASDGEEAAKFLAALEDDLNTPSAYAVLFEMAEKVRASITSKAGDLRERRDTLRKSGGLIGLLQAAPEAWFQGGVDETLKARIDGLIAARVEARAAKNFAEADRIRAELTALNVEVMDNAAGATWRIRDKV